MIVVIFAEREWTRDVYRRATLAEARAFADGVLKGASCYGAGSIAAYVLPEDEGEMRDEQDAAEASRVLAAVAGKDGGS